MKNNKTKRHIPSSKFFIILHKNNIVNDDGIIAKLNKPLNVIIYKIDL